MVKAKKVSSKLRLIQVTGRKKFLLVTVFILIVIGVGTLIRSYAATNSYWLNTYCSWGSANVGICSPAKDAVDKSQTAGVYKITTNSLGMMGEAYGLASNSSQVIKPWNWGRGCAKIKATANSVPKVTMTFKNTYKTFSIPPLSSYHLYCTDYAFNNSSSPVVFEVHLAATKKGDEFNIAGFSADNSDAQPPNAPLPSK